MKSVALMAAQLFLLHAQALAQQPCTCTTCDGNLPTYPLQGMYTDQPSYVQGQPVKVHGSWPNQAARYRVLRLTPDVDPDEWQEMAKCVDHEHTTALDPVCGKPPLKIGSFVDYAMHPALTLSGKTAFTLEGWILATHLPPSPVAGDLVCIAGQVSLSTTKGAGIVITADGRLSVGVKTQGPSGPTYYATSPPNSLTHNDRWYYVAATFDSANTDPTKRVLRLYIGSQMLDASQPLTCAAEVASVAIPMNEVVYAPDLPFRLGARAEAPGDRTGCFNGRLDRWGVWNRALSLHELGYRMNQGLDGTTGCSPTAVPDPTGLELFADFEEATFPTKAVTQDNRPACPLDPAACRWGRVINQGTPGMAGRPANGPNAGKSLRLNHDQLVDAGFELHHTFPIGFNCTLWPSGYYAIQAVLKDSNQMFDPHSTENTRAENFACFVVRPRAACVGPKIAVLVPTNTSMAYNSWPGPKGVEYGLCSPEGITQLRDLFTAPGDIRYLSQGNNSVYAKMGDRSLCHYSGWRRPNLQTSPVLTLSSYVAGHVLNPCGAWLHVKAFEWLESPIPDPLPPTPTVTSPHNGPYAYHAFTDLDLDLGRLVLGNYDVLMIIGKAEYWSQSMISKVHAFLESGGNILCVSGCNLAYRAELFETLPDGFWVPNLVLESKKWPQINLGAFDPMSMKGDPLHPEPSGFWRYMLQCRGEGTALCDPSGYPNTQYQDYFLGTINDQVGGACGLTRGPVKGLWQVFDSVHWLWEFKPPTTTGLLLPGRTVGGEADSYVCFQNTSCQLFAGDAPNSLPLWNQFPFSENGKVAVLARGMNMQAVDPTALTCTFPRVNWCSPIHDERGKCCDDFTEGLSGLRTAHTQYPVTANKTGNIVYYRYKSVAPPGTLKGRVLTIGSLDAALALRADRFAPDLPNDPLNDGNQEFIIPAMVRRALECMLYGLCPPDIEPNPCYGNPR